VIGPRLRNRVGWLALLGSAMVVGPVGTSLATAQTAPARPAPAAVRPPRIEIGLGATFVGKTDFGSSSANLIKPDGSNLVLFQTSNELATGVGLELNLGYAVTRRLTAEASAAWVKADLRSSVSGDFENASPLTTTETLSRVTVEGAASWTLLERGRTMVFARGSVGWMRELVGTGVLYEDGLVATAGGGVKYWWRDRSRGRLRRAGLRVDARVASLAAAITLGNPSRHYVPMVAGGIIFGF
jgi:hypothetical protein